jgi:hypothetical protein
MRVKAHWPKIGLENKTLAAIQQGDKRYFWVYPFAFRVTLFAY